MNESIYPLIWQADLGGTCAKMTAMSLALLADKGSFDIRTSIKRLARHVEASPRSIQASLRTLQDLGVIRIVERGGKGPRSYGLFAFAIDKLREEIGETRRRDIEADANAYVKAVIPASLRVAVFARDGHCCQHCGVSEDLCADHVIPESRGGPTTFENLQTLCRSCNSRKGTRAA